MTTKTAIDALVSKHTLDIKNLRIKAFYLSVFMMSFHFNDIELHADFNSTRDRMKKVW